jgi:hypothetical protein
VPRDQVEADLIRAVKIPGKQIVIYGESGSGKSTLLRNVIDRFYSKAIYTRCDETTSINSILYNAFDNLDKYYLETSKHTQQDTTKSQLGSDIKVIKASLEAEYASGTEGTSKRILSPQLTAQRLGEMMGGEGACWIIEDFHKVPEAEKSAFAQTLKMFSDLAADFPTLKVVAIGATDTAREVVQYDREMANRVAEIFVPLMTDAELMSIVTSGSRMLNIDARSIAADIVGFSAGLAAVCHNLCLNSCLAADVGATMELTKLIGPIHLKAALKVYAKESSDTLKARFDAALVRHQVRKYDNARLIISALAGGPVDGMLYSEILSAVHTSNPSYPASNLTKYLGDLRTEQRGELIRKGKDGRYRFSEPLLHVFAQAISGSRRVVEDNLTYRILVESWRSSELDIYLTGGALGGVELLQQPPRSSC